MGSQPQYPDFRIDPENFHPCMLCVNWEHHIKSITTYVQGPSWPRILVRSDFSLQEN